MTILHDPSAAEDAAQEAFVRAWRHAESYDPRKGRVLTWLLAIVRHVAFDAVRLKRAEPVDPELVALQVEQNGDGSRLDGTGTVDERERLREALKALPTEQQRALLLAAYGGHTAREIGELEGIPLGTAKTRIRSAMIRLREQLEAVDGR